MPQLHLYVSDDLAREITRRAEAKQPAKTGEI